MQEHHDLHKQCEQFSSDQAWLNASSEELSEFCGKLKLKNVDMPTNAKLACFARALRDWTLLQHSIEAKLPALMRMIAPWPVQGDSGDGFDPEAPMARHIEGSPAEKMERMKDAILSKVLGPMIKDGERGHESFKGVIVVVLEMIKQASDDETIDFEPCEDHADSVMSTLKGAYFVLEQNFSKVTQVSASSKDYDRLVSEGASGKQLFSVVTAMKHDCDVYLPRFDTAMDQLGKVAKFGFEEHIGVVMQAWNLLLESRGKLRKGQDAELRAKTEKATMDMLSSVSDAIEADTIPTDRCSDLKELVGVTTKMDFQLPSMDSLISHVCKVSQQRNIDTHIDIMMKCLGSHDVDAERGVRTENLESPTGQVKLYNDYGVGPASGELCGRIVSFVLRMVNTLGAGEDTHLSGEVISYLSLACQIGSALSPLVKDPSEEVKVLFAALATLSGVELQLSSVIMFKKIAATSELSMATSDGQRMVKNFATAHAVLPE
ncbi:unnamed protein product, partial [Prorocentrum cordatum]